MVQEPDGAPEYLGQLPEQEHRDGHAQEHAQGVERQLAQYAFVREELDREVRLFFRDAPAPNLAAAFKEAGAALISITGERVSTAVGTPDPDEGRKEPAKADTTPEAEDQPPTTTPGAEDQPPANAGPVHSAPMQGNLLLRYFFALRETVYTVSLASPTGVCGSVAVIYPGARLLERELQARLGMVFT